MWELIQTIPFPTQSILAYSNGKFITVGDTWKGMPFQTSFKGKVYYSQDITNTGWTVGDSTLMWKTAMSSVGDNNGFLIGCIEGLYQSSNGIDWSIAFEQFNTQNYRVLEKGITSNGIVYVACLDKLGKIFTSNDRTTWVESYTISEVNENYSMMCTYNSENGTFYFNLGGEKIYYTSDLINYDYLISPLTGRCCDNFVYGGGKFVANNDYYNATSVDTINWTYGINPALFSGNLYYYDNKFYISGTDGIYESINGSNWELSLSLESPNYMQELVQVDSCVYVKTGDRIYRNGTVLNEIHHGLFYNKYAVDDARKITSSDEWIVPTTVELNEFVTFIGNESYKLKSTGDDDWFNNQSTDPTNEYLFNGLGSGNRGTYGEFGYKKVFLSLHYQSDDGFNRTFILNFSDDYIGGTNGEATEGHSLRLIKVSTTLTHGQTGIYIGNDEKVYRTICIGNQEWLADNLAETQYRDKSIIPFAGSNGMFFNSAEWSSLATPGCCAFDNLWSSVPMNPPVPYTYTEIKHGLLYNHFAITDGDEVSSSNSFWVPEQYDFQILQSFLASESAGGMLKETGFTYWNEPNLGATNEVGFNGRGSGKRWHDDGLFGAILDNTWFYIYDEFDFEDAYIASLVNFSNLLFGINGGINKRTGASIRLVNPYTKLTHGQTGIYIGNDGKVYRTICIGTQEWLAENLAETLYKYGTPIPTAGVNGINFTDAEWAALSTPACCAYNNDWNNVYNIPFGTSSYGDPDIVILHVPE